jgi:hypothetical protein
MPVLAVKDRIASFRSCGGMLKVMRRPAEAGDCPDGCAIAGFVSAVPAKSANTLTVTVAPGHRHAFLACPFPRTLIKMLIVRKSNLASYE